MANSHRAPKQWCLTKHETISSFESWRQNLQYTLSLDTHFSTFLVPGFYWEKRTKDNPLRGFRNDVDRIPIERRYTAQQKVNMLELMLGQIANYCPILSRNTIVRNSTSLDTIWQAIRLHFGFQTTGAHLLDFNDISLQPDERPEDLYQRIIAFIEDNLLTNESSITHHGDHVADEEVTPSLENFAVLTWLRLLHPALPKLIKQRYGTELRSRTLASIRPEISQALTSLLDEVQAGEEAKILRASSTTNLFTNKPSHKKPHFVSKRQLPKKTCPICKQTNKQDVNHFLSACPFLPDADRRYMARARQIIALVDSDEHLSEDSSDEPDAEPSVSEGPFMTVPSARRIHISSSPYLDVFCDHHTVRLTLDSGATGNMIRQSTAIRLGAKIIKSTQSAHQADGFSPLETIGETEITFSRDKHQFLFKGLVIKSLDVDILAGVPFMEVNDVYARPATRTILLGDGTCFEYGTISRSKDSSHSICRAKVLRAPPIASTIWPGDYIEVQVPEPYNRSSEEFALEPQRNVTQTKNTKLSNVWPLPGMVTSVSGRIRIPNLSNTPVTLQRNEHFCQIRPVFVPEISMSCRSHDITIRETRIGKTTDTYSESVTLDPDNILTPASKQDFKSLLSEFDDVFSPSIPGYNGAMGPFKAVVQMGPVLPPQRKGRLPQYNRDRLLELQDKFDELEEKGVFVRPEDAGISVEYVNPSFLVNKPNGGTRLVTAFADVGRYSKPQPSLLPDIDSTLRKIAQWKHIITTDLSSAFYQIPLSKDSMKFCGVVTPFRGVRVYARSAMGMPGSETALEELLCRVLGSLLKEGIVVKIADDLFCGGNTISEVLNNWRRVLARLLKANLHLSARKTVICPKSTTILGWTWNSGSLSAKPHRIATLVNCPVPPTIKGLRSFIGAYKVLSRVLPGCASILSPLDDITAGKESKNKIEWSEDRLAAFYSAQKELAHHKSIVIPRPEDQLWIVTDGSTKNHGIGATMYITRDGKLRLAGFFSAKLRARQYTWIPCEIEALAIASATKHFSPYIIQSKTNTVILTDSKPCVQAYEKLARGEFSTSPRVLTFLSTASRYQAAIRHLAGAANLPSDFTSRNAPACSETECQICSFIRQLENATVCQVDIQDILKGAARLPFTSRTAWSRIQEECSVLRRTRAHLRQGTRPSKKVTNVKDVKRYLRVASISNDGLLVVRRHEPLHPTQDSIIVPRQFLDGLLVALHIQLGHPTCHQMKLVFQRYFYALDCDSAISLTSTSCHHCASLTKVSKTVTQQTSCPPPEVIGSTFAADVIKRNRQLIFVLRETVTSFTTTMLIENERAESLRDALIRSCVDFRPLSGPFAVVRIDPAPGFQALIKDKLLEKERISLELGRIKNPNKNPVAEKAVQEIEEELVRHDPHGGSISSVTLAIVTARLNSRIRCRGLSAREMWTHRDQFTNDQIPVDDHKLISDQNMIRTANHEFSEKSKTPSNLQPQAPTVSIGDMVYLSSDRQKTCGRPRYLVVHKDGTWLNIAKFTGNQLRSTSYRVRDIECFKVPSSVISVSKPLHTIQDLPDDEVQAFHNPPTPPPVPELLSEVDDQSYDSGVLLETDPTVPDDACDTSIESTPNIICPTRQSKRHRVKPGHLDDYVTDF